MTNTINGAVASQYDYVNDLLGRRTEIGKSGSMMADANETQYYGYSVRDELISGQNQTYAYDDIGNRTIAEGKIYVANNLNQYTAIDDFVPEYDADGNQTLIKTETGVWSVLYNAENRPVRWTQGDTVITMAFDRLGRRVEYHETRAGQVATHFRFVYDNFLCVQRLDATNDNTVRTEFVWDPTEPIATRPLVFQPASGETAYYFHDGNKNVSELFYHAPQNGIAAHYDYAPFGAVTRTARATRVTNRDLLSENPFRFSSEYYDVMPGLTYYNYRHYQYLIGRWANRDPLGESEAYGLFSFCDNSPLNKSDFCGMQDWADFGEQFTGMFYTPDTVPVHRDLEPYESCCDNTIYDTRYYCCENNQIVAKVPMWICNRPLDGWPVKWGALSHSFVTFDNPETTPLQDIIGLGKHPSDNRIPGFISSPGIIKKEEDIDWTKTTYFKILVCPHEKERRLQEETPKDMYNLILPFSTNLMRNNCHGWAWGLSQ